MPENLGKVVSILSTADLSANSSQYLGVDLDANGKLVVPANGARIVGVVLNNPAPGQSGEVQIDGIAQVVAGAAVAAGARVQVNASGQFITFAPGAGIYAVGRALEAAAGLGNRFSVLLDQYGLA